MKNKDINWLEDKIQDIKQRKRDAEKIKDPFLKKKAKEDLNREYRNSKRSEKNYFKRWLKDELLDINVDKKS
jgi:hypothetical protein